VCLHDGKPLGCEVSSDRYAAISQEELRIKDRRPAAIDYLQLITRTARARPASSWLLDSGSWLLLPFRGCFKSIRGLKVLVECR
jgi:hypothetical protein